MAGRFVAKIDGFETSVMIRRISDSCKVISLYEENGSVYLKTLSTEKKKLTRLCSDNSWNLDIVREYGIWHRIRGYIKRYGIAAGVVIGLALLLILSNIALDIRVVGTDDPDEIRNIKEIVANEGIKPGAYIPSLNFLKAESSLFSISDDIAWVSIGHSGSVVTVNVSMATPRVRSDAGRMPCNIVAKRDGQIIKADVMVGELCTLLGNAVKKGDILVSGIVDNKNGGAYYYHAMASITAQYTQTIELSQSLIDVVSLDKETVYRKYLSFFDFDICITPFVKPFTEAKISSSTVPISFFGIKLPIGIRTVSYTKTKDYEIMYTEAEAKEILMNKINLYEKNLIADQSIISKETDIETNDSGVYIRVEYILQGDIATESPIFIDDKRR